MLVGTARFVSHARKRHRPGSGIAVSLARSRCRRTAREDDRQRREDHLKDDGALDVDPSREKQSSLTLSEDGWVCPRAVNGSADSVTQARMAKEIGIWSESYLSSVEETTRRILRCVRYSGWSVYYVYR